MAKRRNAVSAPRAKRAPAYGYAVALVIVSTLIVYAPVVSHHFIPLDDYDYVAQNTVVAKGLTSGGIAWALTTFHAGNWHPLTWVSHMIDVSLFALQPGSHLLMNALLHALAAAALFAALRALTQHAGRSLAVALLFALHPLAVQSAAWISERKNVLCALFWFLALCAYARWVAAGRRRDYRLVMLFFALALLAKPMAVTFPAALLLIDYWPLRRFNVVEKLPLFALSAVSSILTVKAQHAGGAIQTLDAVPASMRVANTVLSYFRYLEHALWPSRLAVFYPYRSPSTNAVAIAAAVLLAISIAVFLLRRRHPFLLTGWLWYLGTLVPMIGLVQVGEQSMADRYTYVPLIGIFMAVVWLAGELLQPLARGRVLQPALLAVVCVAFAIRTHAELRHWRNGRELFTRAIELEGPSTRMCNVLGATYVDDGDFARAEVQFRTALALGPKDLEAHVNLANTLMQQDRLVEAIAAYETVLALAPSRPDIHNSLGVALAREGRLQAALPHFEEALRIEPRFELARENLAQLAPKRAGVSR